MTREDIDKNSNVISTITTIDQFVKRWNIEEHNGIQLGESTTQATLSRFIDALMFTTTKIG